MEKMDNYKALDIMKYAAALMVIIVHCDTLISQPEINFFIKNIACRIAVPFFFISSAFFVRRGIQTRADYLKNYLKSLSKSYLVWSIIFLPVGLDWIHQNLTVPAHMLPAALLVGLIHIGTYYHLWYIPALILSLVLTTQLLKRFSYPTVFAGSLLLFLFGSLETYYGFLPAGWLKEFFDLFIQIFFTTRSGLLFGMIFTLIGFFIYDYQEKLHPWTKYSAAFTVFFGSLLLAEGVLLYQVTRLDMNFLLMLVPFSFCFFVWLLSGTFNLTIPAKKLRELSKYYYFVHPVCIVLVEESGKALNLSILSSGLFSFLLIVLLTHLFTSVILQLQKHSPGIALLAKALLLGAGMTLLLAGTLYHFKVSATGIKFEFVPCLWIISSYFALFLLMDWRTILSVIGFSQFVVSTTESSS